MNIKQAAFKAFNIDLTPYKSEKIFTQSICANLGAMIRPLLIAAFAFAPGAFAAAETVGPNVFVDDGESLDVLSSAPIETTGEVTVAPGGDAEFRSGQKVTLKPGFIASPGSTGLFRAAIDTSLLDPDQYLGPGWEPFIEYHFGSAYVQTLQAGDAGGLYYVDDFQSDPKTNPLASDTDGDGIPDASESGSAAVTARNAIFQ